MRPTFRKPKRSVSRVFLHCTASDHVYHDNLETLHKWHVEDRGWSAIGYHYLIRLNGEVLETDRSLERTPAAQRGHNKGTIAIALSGGQYGRDEAFTAAQFRALTALCQTIDDAYDGKITFHGHSEVAPGRACPVYDYSTLLGLNAQGKIIRNSKMNGTKSFLKSRTLLAAGAGILATIVEGLWGLKVTQGELLTLADNAAALTAFAGTMWGRIQATRRLT